MHVNKRNSESFILKAAFIPPVVNTGTDQMLANLLTGERTYGHTGPRNTSGLEQDKYKSRE